MKLTYDNTPFEKTYASLNEGTYFTLMGFPQSLYYKGKGGNTYRISETGLHVNTLGLNSKVIEVRIKEIILQKV
jgi:hypothetical protein